MEFESGISFGFGKDEMYKKNATVADLIDILQEFPSDMQINAFFECIVDKDRNIVMLEDRRIATLVEFMMSCPFCRETITVSDVDKKVVN